MPLHPYFLCYRKSSRKLKKAKRSAIRTQTGNKRLFTIEAIKRASCIIKMWMLKIENTSEYNKTTDWQVSKNLIIQRGIYNEV